MAIVGVTYTLLMEALLLLCVSVLPNFAVAQGVDPLRTMTMAVVALSILVVLYIPLLVVYGIAVARVKVEARRAHWVGLVSVLVTAMTYILLIAALATIFTPNGQDMARNLAIASAVFVWLCFAAHIGATIYDWGSLSKYGIWIASTVLLLITAILIAVAAAGFDVVAVVTADASRSASSGFQPL